MMKKFDEIELSQLTDWKNRWIVNSCFQWAFGGLVVDLIAFVVRDWRNYFVIINFVTCPLLIGYLLLKESPRWLIQKGRLNDAAYHLSRLASEQWNNRNVVIYPEELKNLPREVEKRR